MGQSAVIHLQGLGQEVDEFLVFQAGFSCIRAAKQIFYTQDDLKDQSKIAEKVEANVMKMAKEAGLDTEKLKEDMNGEVVARELRNVRDMAQRFEINGTPFLIIGEQAFPGAIPADQIEAALDE